jgi:hypothetical protein
MAKRNTKPAGVIHFTSGNEKLEYTGRKNGCYLFAFGLPAITTCPFAGKCKDGCYASVGNFRFPSVKNRLEDNLAFSKSENFVADAIAELKALVKWANGIKVAIRLHDSGDFYNLLYIKAWFEIMRALPEIQFYAYTKSFVLIEMVGNIPSNFNYIPSKGGLQDRQLEDRPCAVVVPEGTTQEMLPVGTVLGGMDDLENLRNFIAGKTVALAAHGAKRRAFGNKVA